MPADPLAERHTKSFFDHLDDLRSTLIGCATALLVGILVAAPLAPLTTRVLQVPLRQAGEDPATFLRVLNVTGGFSVAMSVIFWSGLLFSLPFMVVILARFVAPGLTPRERTAALRASWLAVALFIAGVCLGYFAALPAALRWLIGINSWLGMRCEFVEFSTYTGFILRLLLAFGLAFELPVGVLVLGHLGLVSVAQLRSRRRVAIVLIFLLAAILTPTPDAYSQILLAVPMVGLYELCIVLLNWQGRRAAAP